VFSAKMMQLQLRLNRNNTTLLFDKEKVLRSFKRQYHEIFDLHFFHKSIAPRALINTLKYFLILFRFRAEISKFILACIARSRDSALRNIARSFSKYV
jgi:hypothetical protein